MLIRKRKEYISKIYMNQLQCKSITNPNTQVQNNIDTKNNLENNI